MCGYTYRVSWIDSIIKLGQGSPLANVLLEKADPVSRVYSAIELGTRLDNTPTKWLFDLDTGNEFKCISKLNTTVCRSF